MRFAPLSRLNLDIERHAQGMASIDFKDVYEELVKLTEENFNEGNLDALFSHYDEHAVIVDKIGRKVGYGEEQIRSILKEEIGKLDFKSIKKEVVPLAGDRFYTNCQYENTIRETGKVVRGSYQEIWARRDNQWKVIFVTYDQKA